MSHHSEISWRLRDLPLPAKLVLSVFLMSVGLGYFSAMIQLHMQHTLRNGEPMPGPDDLIAKFSGKQRVPEGGMPEPVSKIEFLIMGNKDGDLTKDNMAPAFFAKSSKYESEIKKLGKEKVDAERENERQAMREWIKAEPAARKKAYEDDSFVLSDKLAAGPLHEDFFDEEKKAVRISSLIEKRCGKCHSGETKPDLDEYPKIEKFLEVPKVEALPPGSWMKSPRQLSIEGLTQSTHAHLLSFSVLFTLTGLVFAFSDYHKFFRCLLGPVVLIAQVADISCWWLARLDQMGPTFALCIMATGAVVGLGLSLQIVLSLFNMYGVKGKSVLILIFLVGLIGMSVLFFKGIKPGLDKEKESAAEAAAAAAK